MGQRHHHYEAAFEAWLREARLPYVMVDEQRRALAPDRSLKSLDFIVSHPSAGNLLVDVKGRQFPGSHKPGGTKWANWTPEADLGDIHQWEQLFGSQFRGLFVFAYEVREPASYPELTPYFRWRDRYYAFYGIWVDDYCRHERLRSPSWETVHLPAAIYRELRFPLHELTDTTSSPAERVSA